MTYPSSAIRFNRIVIRIIIERTDINDKQHESIPDYER